MTTAFSSQFGQRKNSPSSPSLQLLGSSYAISVTPSIRSSLFSSSSIRNFLLHLTVSHRIIFHTSAATRLRLTITHRRLTLNSCWIFRSLCSSPAMTTVHSPQNREVDVVTETDKGCEELVFNHLKQLFPNHKFIGEETTAANGVTELTDEPTWIVDPLDGTTNFVHGFPFVCVSIGLTIGKVPVVGVVYNPIMDELFTGVQGKGAFLNGKPIKVSTQSELVTALLLTEGTKRDQATLDYSTNRINSLLTKVRSLRMSGSCALDLCGVACGRADIFYEFGFGGPWDIAAGIVIVREAGGLIFDPSGKDLDITSQRIAASNASLKELFVEALRITKA